jgi:hypothetical protein
MNGISWPVVPIVWTPDMPVTIIVFSMKTIRQVIVTALKVCIARQRRLSHGLCVLAQYDIRRSEAILPWYGFQLFGFRSDSSLG